MKIRYLLGIPFLLCSCDADKIPLSGKRESFLALAPVLQADQGVALRPMVLTEAKLNSSWEQAGGGSSHNLAPLKMGSPLMPHGSLSVGEGISDAHPLLPNFVVHKDHVYGMDASGDVYAVFEGKILWKKSSQVPGESVEVYGGGVAVDDTTLYVTTSFGEVIAFDTRDGSICWRKTLSAPIRTSPTLQGTVVYCVTLSNQLFALDRSTGHELWNHQGIPETVALMGGSKPAFSDSTVITAYSSGEVYALASDNGYPLWTDLLASSVRTESSALIAHIRARPIIHQGKVFVISHGGKMVAFDLKSGIRHWEKSIGGIRTPAVDGNWIFVLTLNNELLCLDTEKGGVRWITQLPRKDQDKILSFAGPVLANKQLVLTGSHGKILFIDAQTGKIASELSYKGSSSLSPVIAQGILYILTDEGLLHTWK